MTAEEYISKISDLQETDLEQALTVCDEGIAAYPNNAKLYYLKAETLWSQENFDSTILRDLLKKSSELDPHDAAPYFLWGCFNERLCCPDEALYCYQRVVELEPANPAGWYRLGKLEQEEFGNLPGALKAFDKVVALAPNDQAYNSRGHLRMEMNDFSGAIEDFNKALELNPQAGGSLWGRGLCKKELGDLSGAVEDFSQMLALYPQIVAGYMDRANVRKLQKDLIGALKDYQTVVTQLDPENKEAWAHIADLQNRLMQQVPANTAVLCTTLKSGHQAKNIPINGQMVTFLDVPQVAKEPAPDIDIAAISKAIKLLKEKQAKESTPNINKPNVFGETPLLKAIKKGDVEQVKNLIVQGADVNYVNVFKKSALGVAVREGKLEIVKLLIAAGADVNRINTFQESVLMTAVKEGNLEIVKLLIGAGADIHYKNRFNESAFTIAKKYKFTEISFFLAEANARK